jgi:hypothetical protein
LGFPVVVFGEPLVSVATAVAVTFWRFFFLSAFIRFFDSWRLTFFVLP